MSESSLIALGHCWACKRPLAFDPDRVPSVPIDPETDSPPDLGGDASRAVLQPICADCVELANEARARRGRTDMIVVLPGAYPPPLPDQPEDWRDS